MAGGMSGSNVDGDQADLFHSIVCQGDEGMEKQEGDGTQDNGERAHKGKGSQTMLNLFGRIIGNSTKVELAIV